MLFLVTSGRSRARRRAARCTVSVTVSTDHGESPLRLRRCASRHPQSLVLGLGPRAPKRIVLGRAVILERVAGHSEAGGGVLPPGRCYL